MEFVIVAATFGISAGFAPGPFMALILTESLSGGWRRGVLASMAPLITDGAMILLSLWMLSAFSPPMFAVMEGVGGLVMFYFGYSTWKIREARPEREEAVAYEGASGLAPLWRGIAVNALNPTAWLFWFTAGGTFLQRAYSAGTIPVLLFLLVFFTLLIGSKVLVAVVTGQRWIGGRLHRTLLMSSGAALWGLGVYALFNGLSYFL
ncbi:LysE family translocator [Desmospora profundinema]|uniref:Threonine/homoserine/homoserine lactone efflux protein n=1 Tax=Desmospora profundinema TaxID=1571184 RepID=A0ABU1IS31_9BACL|nr:LysE family transporter [Desmospora profundinema]MDR6226724.1 threonine/homoserine/homoserine lactone efflux protein [Desmospora profundinema]